MSGNFLDCYLSKGEQWVLEHEGFLARPKRIGLSRIKIGIGRDLHADGVNEEEAFLMLKNDFKRRSRWLQAEIPTLEGDRAIAVIDLLFEIPLADFMKQKELIKELKAREWGAASGILLHSNWHLRLGARIEEIATVLRTGELRSKEDNNE